MVKTAAAGSFSSSKPLPYLHLENRIDSMQAFNNSPKTRTKIRVFLFTG